MQEQKSRREFLKSAAAVGGVAGVASLLPGSSSALVSDGDAGYLTEYDRQQLATLHGQWHVDWDTSDLPLWFAAINPDQERCDNWGVFDPGVRYAILVNEKIRRITNIFDAKSPNTTTIERIRAWRHPSGSTYNAVTLRPVATLRDRLESEIRRNSGRADAMATEFKQAALRIYKEGSEKTLSFVDARTDGVLAGEAEAYKDIYIAL